MAYDAMAGYIHELNPDVFADVIPDTYQAFLDVLEKHDQSLDAVALAMDCDDWNVLDDELSEEAITEIETACHQVQRMFNAKTGLRIVLTQIEGGSVYNEVEGAVWNVINAEEPTEPARVFERFIDKKFFCIFG